MFCSVMSCFFSLIAKNKKTVGLYLKTTAELMTAVSYWLLASWLSNLFREKAQLELSIANVERDWQERMRKQSAHHELIERSLRQEIIFKVLFYTVALVSYFSLCYGLFMSKLCRNISACIMVWLTN